MVGIVTGAGSAYGIGRSMVLAAAAAGATAVYACDLNLSYTDELKQEVQSARQSCVVEGRFLDVSNEEQTVALLKDIVKTPAKNKYRVLT